MALSTIVRLAVSFIAGVGLLATFILAKGRFVDARNWFAIPLLAWWLGPLAYYDWRARTAIGAALIGAALIIAGAVLLRQTYRSQGSTAAVGLLVAPLLIWAPLVLLVELDRVLSR